MSLPNELQIEYLSPHELNDYNRELRTIPETQITKSENLIQECGLSFPIPIGKENVVLHGQHFVEAARRMGIEQIPVIRHEHLSEEQERILRIALDRIPEESEWKKEEMALELTELQLVFPDLGTTGLDPDEISLFMDLIPDEDTDDDTTTFMDGPTVVQKGDLWDLGDHRLYNGDALEEESYQILMGDEKAQMCFTDSPYNVKIDGHVGNSGDIKHREFVQASGEMNVEQFTEFETRFHQHMASYSEDGAIIFSCMDWRHIREIMDAAAAANLDMINFCVWVKDNGGMGSLNRTKHELVFVFKNGKAKHINNVQLGSNGRYRTNIWQYAGVNSFGNDRMEELQMHPTVKPTQMVMDAIKDCSKRGGIILDPFGGSGTTLIAAEKTGRKARLIELDSLYCDTTIRRWQGLTGQDAVHVGTGKTYNETLEQKGQNDE
jgi:DNA modification methylase